jgi:transcriptional regulator with XRE-family HTH domain
MVENPRLVLGLKVRTMRHQRGETLQTLAERSGLSVSYLSEIEKGKKYPKPERLVLLAEALEVPFDELVSLQVADELAQLKAAFDSPLLRGFPFELFGLEPEDLLSLVSGDPERGSAFLRAVAEVGRSYDVHVEHFLLSALRAYQQLHANYFEDLEEEAMAFRRQCGWSPEQKIPRSELVSVLQRQWGYRVDDESLGQEPELAGFRSVHLPGEEATLFVNPRLMPSQKAFVLAREVGFRFLGLEQRAPSSPWLAVESFDQVFNNFKASYFAGALLMDRERLRGDLGRLFSAESWDATAVGRLMDSYGVTPETFLHRLTQILPRFFGLNEFFFLRFSTASPSGSSRLTKWLNTSEVAVPRGFGLSEHYCRRWPAFRLLAAASELVAAEERLITAQRVWFVDSEAEFLELSMARPLALGDGALSAVTVGFLVDANLRRKVRFWSDPALSRVEVGLTCERCKLTECTDRVEPASILDRIQEQSRKEGALQRLASVS